jgi:hypothetical protein
MVHEIDLQLQGDAFARGNPPQLTHKPPDTEEHQRAADLHTPAFGVLLDSD